MGVYLVTGAAGSIGNAIIEELRGKNNLVLGVDLKAPNVKADYWLETDLEKLTTTNGIHEFSSQLSTLLAGQAISGIVNNAAVQVVDCFEDLSVEKFTGSMNINCVAAYGIVKACAPFMVTSEPLPVVVNIGSIHARLTKPGFVAYATSKAALEGLTRALAVECGEYMRVCAISPAAIETEMLQAGFSDAPELLTSLADCHPTRKLGMSLEVAKIAALLLASDLPFSNGGVWDLTGGIAGRLHDPR